MLHDVTGDILLSKAQAIVHGGRGVRGAPCVINLLTQEPAQRPGKATTTHVNHVPRELHKYVLKEKLSSIALPRVASGVGAGWIGRRLSRSSKNI